jgi:hypothetical protein
MRDIRYMFIFRQKNIRTNFSLSVLLYFCLCLSGCERRELTYYREAEITIRADWSRSGLEEAGMGATALFYPAAGGIPKVVLMGDRKQETVRLSPGIYHVIIFNRTFDDFSGIGFRGDTHATLSAYARQVELRDGTGETVIVGVPEAIASDAVENFEVTESMLGNYSPLNSRQAASGDAESPDPCLLCLSPRSLVKNVVVKINIKGLNNVRSAVGLLEGVSESVLLKDGTPSGNLVTQQFELGEIRFADGSLTEGSVTGNFPVFGFATEVPHRFVLKMLLVDGKTQLEQDFTVVPHELEEEGRITLYMEVDAETVPDVKPEGGSDSGFDVDVDDWGDEKDSDIEIK